MYSCLVKLGVESVQTILPTILCKPDSLSSYTLHLQLGMSMEQLRENWKCWKNTLNGLRNVPALGKKIISRNFFFVLRIS